MKEFSYTPGTCAVIDHMCRMNKIVLVKDLSLEPSLVELFEKILEFPVEDLIVLRVGMNISALGFSRMKEKLQATRWEQLQKDNMFLFASGNIAIINNFDFVIPWQTLQSVVAGDNPLYYNV